LSINFFFKKGTISVAKAGIIATLNSRCAVFAAANPTYGSWDDTKGAENIGFMPTILSRFDMIFIIKDNVDLTRDTALVNHIMNVHINNKSLHDGIPTKMLTKYIHYCRTHCAPRMNLESIRRISDNYVLMRSNVKELQKNNQVPIPITVRQLESIIRIAESIAKLQLNNFVTETHIDEALRLFRLSTIDAVNTSKSTEYVSTIKDDILVNIKRQLKQRFTIGASHMESIVICTLVDNLHHPRQYVDLVIKQMLLSGEFIHTHQQKYLKRIK
jgi:DNA replication licensing factor MCM5